MTYNQYRITSDADHDILIAFLAEDGFDSFSEGEGNSFYGYRSSKEHAQAAQCLQQLQDRFGLTYEWSQMPDKNWNETWESQFQPIKVRDRLGIRASFHEPMKDVSIELVIDPKMAFGTGHHATTWMVSNLMFEVDFKDKTVLDYGCGTGVLSLLAKKLGAGFTWAVDIEKPSYENTIENAFANDTMLDVVTHGTLDDVVDDKKFDMILANINRNVILGSLPTLHQRMTAGGLLFVSGILEQDAQRVEQEATLAGFTQQKRQEREGWYAWIFAK